MISSNSKYFFLATNTGYYAYENPTQECIEFYEKRSSDKLNTVIVGNVLTVKGYGTNNHCGRISDGNNWKALSDTIKRKGSIPGIQLSTTWKQYIGQKNFINVKWDDYKTKTIAIMKDINISEHLRDLKLSAIIARNNGFQHVQIHAAHGYLYSMLIDPYFSSNANYVIDEISKLVGELKKEDIIVSIRISQYCGFNNDIESNRKKAILRLCQGPYDYIDISEGYYNYDKTLIYPCGEQAIIERGRRSISLAKELDNKKVVISGRKSIDKSYPSNVYIGICRSLVANPAFLNDYIDVCDECGECNYFSRGERKLHCSKWNNRYQTSA